MPMTLVIPDGFSYVGGALLSTVVLLLGQGFTVSKFRSKAGVKYPQMYAEKSESDASLNARKFNCAQRAHQNTLESIPSIYLTTLLAGLKFPKFAAGACLFWTFSRIMYTRGYCSGEPQKRLSKGGAFHSLILVGLLGTSIYNIATMISA